ncbi:MAG: YwmB family TATA-box binding protein [Actinomycetia bacterium]|nr:YwmB family TATA-box binding protein [Actinomycetes bacterium]
MRLVFWGLAALVAAALWVRATPARPGLTAAFAATGAQAVGYSLNDWVALPNSAADLAGLARGVARRLGVGAAPVASRGPGWRKVTVRGTAGSATTQVVAERVASGMTYLVVDRAVAGGFYGLAENQQRIAQVLSAYGSLHQAVTLEGTVRRPFTPTAAAALVDRAFRRLGAQRVNGVAGRRLVSVAGYAPGLLAPLSLAGRPVDFQCAAVAGGQPGTMEVLVGSPVITVTY